MTATDDSLIKPGQGQWAAGDIESLNPNEAMKAEDDGLNVRARVENEYSKGGFASIPRSDLTGRLRWWGLYTQRKPGIDGGRTATLEPEELEDEYFMLRVRIDGGKLSTEQLRTIAEISNDFARGTADLTDRQNIQLHWIRLDDFESIFQKLEANGLHLLVPGVDRDDRGLTQHDAFATRKQAEECLADMAQD